MRTCTKPHLPAFFSIKPKTGVGYTHRTTQNQQKENHLIHSNLSISLYTSVKGLTRLATSSYNLLIFHQDSIQIVYSLHFFHPF